MLSLRLLDGQPNHINLLGEITEFQAERFLVGGLVSIQLKNMRKSIWIEFPQVRGEI